jgi:hypothetical protein
MITKINTCKNWALTKNQDVCLKNCNNLIKKIKINYDNHFKIIKMLNDEIREIKLGKYNF